MLMLVMMITRFPVATLPHEGSGKALGHGEPSVTSGTHSTTVLMGNERQMHAVT